MLYTGGNETKTMIFTSDYDGLPINGIENSA